MNRQVLTTIIVSSEETEAVRNKVPSTVAPHVTQIVPHQSNIHFVFSPLEFRTYRQLLSGYDLVVRQGGALTYRERCVFDSVDHAAADIFVVFDRARPITRPSWNAPTTFEFGRRVPGLPVPWCWQAGPLRFKKSDLPGGGRALWNTSSMEWCATHSLIRELLGPDGAAIMSRDIEILRGNRPAPFKQVFGPCRLPPFAAGTTGLSRLGKHRLGGETLELVGELLEEGFFPVMDREVVLSIHGVMPEWCFTHEHYGRLPDLSTPVEHTPPWPRLVVGRGVRNLLESMPGSKLEFVPVTWSDRIKSDHV